MKIMIAFDGSEIAQRALAVAQKQAKALDAELHVFCSSESSDSLNGKISRMESTLKDAEMMCRACGIKCRIEISGSSRSTGENIVHYANSNDIDQIVIGLRKRSQLGKMIFGSTSRQVILEAHCPVLTVK